MAPNAMRFLIDGQRIVPDKTPADLDLEDGDQIDCRECHEPGAGVLRGSQRHLIFEAASHC